MAISKAQFKNAFRAVVSAEFSHIPGDESSIDYTFSERFNKRMAKLIKSQRNPYWCLINTAAKRAAVIFVAIITLFTAAFSVKAIREPVLRFIKEVYETFTRYTYEGDMADKITKEYVLTYIPDGFEQTSKIENENSIITTYKNSSGATIVFTQQTTQNHSGYAVDIESGNTRMEKVDGIDVVFEEFYDVKTAILLKDGYVVIIDCHGDMNFETIKQMIASIK